MKKVRSLSKAIFRSLVREANAILRFFWAQMPVRDKTVLYESYAGSGALCNPEAIFRQLLLDPDLSDLRHTWVMAHRDEFQTFRAEFARDRRIRFVRRGSPAYFRALATRRYLVNNATFPPEFIKRPGQIYLNTWHGTPLKRMGYDMPIRGAMEAANTMRNFLSADFLLSQNDFMTHQMYEHAYKLGSGFAGRVIQTGYPRMDRQRLSDSQRAGIEARLSVQGISLGGRQLVLFAPTWRGSRFSSPENNAQSIIEETRRLQDLLGPHKYVVLLKAHQAIHHLVANDDKWRALIVPNDIPTNAILGMTDALVTDYSSVFFDYLPMPGPIIFYARDYEHYSDTRGTYFSDGELPGPFCKDLESVAEAMRTVADGSAVRARRAEWRSTFVEHDDGKASERVVDIVFRGQTERPGIHTLGSHSLGIPSRTSILLHLGSMNSNGITSSALNLLKAMDPEMFDVSVTFGLPDAGSQAAANQQQIPSTVRQFLRPAHAESRLARRMRQLRFLRAQNPRREQSARERRGWERQWRWVFGSATFDQIVDFDGYGPFWANLMLHGPAATHSIWLHNDMAAEQHRVIRGKQRIRRSLGAVFAIYRHFDTLVSVSPALRDLNRPSLGPRLAVPPAKFRSARNIVDGERVLKGAAAEPSESLGRSDGAAPPEWLVDLANPLRSTRWFVSIARISAEKNQARLIRAFNIVHRAQPTCRLLIIGAGPLLGEVEALIARLGLGDSVVLAGFVANPFAVAGLADCFVLSSDYEGQPMVLMEAAILGLPIVSVDFTTVSDALPGSTIHVVARDDDALARGMNDFLEGGVATPEFDFPTYNLAALNEFRLAIGAPSTGGTANDDA